MPGVSHTRNLIIVVADLDAKQRIVQVLQRPQSLGIRRVQFVVDRYAKRDSGRCRTSHEYLLIRHS